MACLDTTVLVDLLRSNPQRKRRALNKIEQLSARGEAIATTRFNVAELYVGLELSDDPQRNYQRVRDVLDELDAILEFDDLVARSFGHITAHLRRSGRPAGDFDVLIAATSIAAGHALLITRNPAHFANIPGLSVESY
ncbi:MAG: type II toxin-antitoxin system VapC family toxin [Thermoguttaceae bacterium]